MEGLLRLTNRRKGEVVSSREFISHVVVLALLESQESCYQGDECGSVTFD